MTQPTQQLPPWLQPSVVIVTDAAGAPIATNTEIVYVPPTYFGPSIPLGSLYIFGGSTFPPTIVFTPTTTVANTATSTATPSTTSPLTTSATPSTTVLTTTSTAITTSPTSSVTPSTTATNSVSASSSASASASVSVSAASSIASISASTTAASISSSTAASSVVTSAASSSASIRLTASSTIPFTSVSGAQPPTQTFTAPTITGAPARFGGLTKGQLVGVIVASILGLIFLFVLALFLCLWCKGRRNRRHRFQSLSPGGEESYVFVPAGSRVPGEGSPRHSGEEADPFLQESSQQANWVSELSPPVAGTSTSRGSYRNSPLANVAAVAESSNGHESGNGNGNGQRNMAQVAGAAVTTRTPVTRVPPPTMGSNSSGSASTVSHASGFGVLLDRPSLSGIGYMPITHEHETEGGRPLSHADMARIDNEQVLPHDDVEGEPDYSGAYAYSRYSEMPPPVGAPPRLVIPGATPSPDNLPLTISNPSSLQDLQEASLQTATRVRAQDLAPRSTPVSPQSSSGPSSARPRSGGFLGALGLGGVGAWFNKNESSSASRHTGVHADSPLSEQDLEQGALLAHDVRQADSLGLRPAGTGLTAEGRRPVSNVSGRSGTSGGTVFHDAHSSLPDTPATPTLAPLPRAVTPAEPSPTMPDTEWFASSQLHSAPRAATPQDQAQPAGSSSFGVADADILDMPAPSALHHFTSGASLKEPRHSGSSSSGGGTKTAPFPPPGLSTIRPVGWSQPTQSQTQTQAPAAQAGAEATSYPSPPASPGLSPFGSGMHGLDLGRGMTMDLDLNLDDVDADMEDDLGLGHGISIDVLEEAPPGAEQGWRSISSAGTGATAYAFMDHGRRGTFGTLVQGPGYASEQGSLHSMRSHVTPGSVRSTGSAPASRHNSSINSASSGRPSLGSSSDGNSATAYHLARSGSLTSDNQRGRRSQQVPGSLATIVASPSKALTVRTTGSDATSTVRPVRSLSPLGGPDFPLNAHWAAGLDNEWQASA